ncbi:MAG: DNA repair exonuclease [Gemmatimonadota bacterium]|nr:DNA repair exonuclease [Gemmatimonadota bacterium]
MSERQSTLRIAHVSDTHLGYRALYRADPETGRNQRSVDVERAYEAAVDDILTREVDLVIHAGDVFHHTRPSWSALRCFVRQTRKVEAAGLPMVVIAGNHDTPRLRTSGSAFSVLELALPGIDFVTEYEERSFQFESLDLALLAVPHGALTNPIPPIAVPEPGTRNVLITHGMVPGLLAKGQREAGEEELSGALLDAGFDYVALGHYHLWGAQGHNAWYSGSTERTGFGDEAVDPGYSIVELGAPGEAPRVEHIPIKTRPMKTLAPLIGDGRTARELADTILDRVKIMDQPDAIARVELKETPRPIRREVEAILRRESPPLVWSLQVFSPADVLAGFGERSGEVSATDVRSLFSQFVTERTGTEYETEFAEAFRERGGQALDEAIRAAEAAAGAEDPAA